MTLSELQKSFIDTAIKKFGSSIITKKQILELQKELGTSKYFGQTMSSRVGRGLYQLPASETETASSTVKAEMTNTESEAAYMPAPKASLSVEHTGFAENLIPAIDPLFVPFGNFQSIKKIVTSQNVISELKGATSVDSSEEEGSDNNSDNSENSENSDKKENKTETSADSSDSSSDSKSDSS